MRIPDAWPTLLALYNSPQRHYHNLAHIHFCVGLVERLFQDCVLHIDEHICLLDAVWWHDAIYNINAQAVQPCYSELESALLYSHHAYRKDGKTQLENVDVAFCLILATACHMDATEDIPARMLNLATPLFEEFSEDKRKLFQTLLPLMLDIDMASLGSEERIVFRHALNIAREYRDAGVTWDQYRAGRIRFLEAMQLKTHIYRTVHFKDLEQQARDNIRHELYMMPLIERKWKASYE